MVRDRGRGGRDCVFIMRTSCMFVCVRVFKMYLHCVCPSLANVAIYKLCGCIGEWVVRVLECTLVYSRYLSPSFGRSTSEGLCRPSETQQTAESDLY